MDMLTVQDVRQRFAGCCSRLLAASPIVCFSPTSAASSAGGAELTNNRSAAALFKDSAVCLSLPLPANPAKQRRPATSNADRAPAREAHARTGHADVKAAAKPSKARGRPNTAAITTFYKPTGLFLLTLHYLPSFLRSSLGNAKTQQC